MPNNVKNKIIFPLSESERIFGKVCPNGKLDFETLIPMPVSVYIGNTSREDETDFPNNWNSWSRINWGTKWNAYSQSVGVEGENAFILFETAWTVPYPFICAFANTFKIPFTHKYFCEHSGEYWGIEKWGNDDVVICDEPFHRISKRYNLKEDKRTLGLELWKWDVDKAENDENYEGE